MGQDPHPTLSLLTADIASEALVERHELTVMRRVARVDTAAKLNISSNQKYRHEALEQRHKGDRKAFIARAKLLENGYVLPFR